jgi:serine/threonine-protein kinase
MTILDSFLLPPDVTIVPVAQLASELGDEIALGGGGDYAITRPRSRARSSVIDAQTAALLETFRVPASIVEAVMAFSTDRDLDPQSVLEDAFPVLGAFINDGVLVAADSELAQPIATSLTAGDRVGAFEIVEPVQVLVDTEVHLARDADGEPVALKIARAGAEQRMRRAFVHEAEILADLHGHVNPRLLDVGELDERPFLALSWCAGVDAHQAATEARALGGQEGRTVLLQLAERVIAAYAQLHAQGVLHGDVHPRNLLVDADGKVTIIDYGLAERPAAPWAKSAGPRGGIDLFLEPELAGDRLAGRTARAPSAAGEQYSIAALVYLLLTGTHTHAFSLQEDEMLRQLHEQPPLSFKRNGVHGLPSVERVLGRALSKRPTARYQSVTGLLDAFRTATARDNAHRMATAPVQSTGQHLLDDVLERLALPGGLFTGGLTAPTASAMNGAAGIAYALLRIGAIRNDEALLALADLWSSKALLAVGSDEAFCNAELEIVPETFGENSFYHHVSGVQCVEALIAHARGDETAQRIALEAFVAAASAPCEHIDVAFGRAGLLLGSALLLEALPAALDTSALRTLGDTLHDSVWQQLQHQPPLRQSTQLRSLGAAHGWAGLLYALLRWSEASGTPPPAGLDERLAQLAALGQPAGRGLRWPHEPGAPAADTALSASWCNGAAGYVYLWTLAHNQRNEDSFLRLAQKAAWSAYEGQAAAPGDLCCGLAGRAYALLNLYRHTGETAWLTRARLLADRAVANVRTHALRRDSLYKGDIGVAVLLADLQAPAHATMALYDAEGWPRQDA